MKVVCSETTATNKGDKKATATSRFLSGGVEFIHQQVVAELLSVIPLKFPSPFFCQKLHFSYVGIFIFVVLYL